MALGATRVRLRDGLHRSHRDRVGGRGVPRAAYAAGGVGGAVRSARGPGPPGRGAARRARRHRSGPRLADRPPAAALATRGRGPSRPWPEPASYLGWVQLRFGDWLLPVRIQQRHNLRGSFANPLATLDHAARGLLDGTEVGTGLHVPWALLLAVGVILAFRYWPVSYGAFAAVMLVAGVSSSNLDSLERYALQRVPVRARCGRTAATRVAGAERVGAERRRHGRLRRAGVPQRGRPLRPGKVGPGDADGPDGGTGRVQGDRIMLRTRLCRTRL